LPGGGLGGFAKVSRQPLGLIGPKGGVLMMMMMWCPRADLGLSTFVLVGRVDEEDSRPLLLMSATCCTARNACAVRRPSSSNAALMYVLAQLEHRHTAHKALTRTASGQEPVCVLCGTRIGFSKSTGARAALHTSGYGLPVAALALGTVHLGTPGTVLRTSVPGPALIRPKDSLQGLSEAIVDLLRITS
jgi:hypothetical protein